MGRKNRIAFPVMAWGIRNRFHSLTAILVAVFVISVIYLTGKNNVQSSDSLATSQCNLLSGNLTGKNNNVASSDSLVIHENSSDSPSQCDLFSGEWVYDNSSYPLYTWEQCSYISDQVACEKFGRKDTKYQNWRWQPHQCNLPRFNATALLEMLRGKRLIYVGDSLNRGQWVSMVCLLESSIPASQKAMDWSGQDGSIITFTAKEYDASIAFYWAPLLLESNSDHPFNHRLSDRFVRIQAIERHARYWTDADVLVFNSYLWWRRPKMKLLWGSFDSSDGIYKEVEMLRSYEMALKTWSDWVEIHVNHTKTKLFFASLSPTHLWNYEWSNAKEGEGNCYNETEPITKQGHWGGGSDSRMMRLVESAVKELEGRGVTVQILNITQMSEYRKEAHPSIYKKQWEPITQEQLSNPTSYADCMHWCLPGVPDAWNEILYALLLHPSSSSNSSSSSSSSSSFSS
ncbi:protein trichome birefringence-like 34 [Telopea speciosissima]|uniref:protein trichome birefringence-like 34 n=1 Tax=Telopea speciosissima TaxID=54955 RepID=UPI001CC4542D|nr:protein trichome birefringence-like 34 [Telopea speciosissima]